VNRLVVDILNASCLSYCRTYIRDMNVEMVLLKGTTWVGDGLGQHASEGYVSRYRLSGTVVEKAKRICA